MIARRIARRLTAQEEPADYGWRKPPKAALMPRDLFDHAKMIGLVPSTSTPLPHGYNQYVMPAGTENDYLPPITIRLSGSPLQVRFKTVGEQTYELSVAPERFLNWSSATVQRLSEIQASAAQRIRDLRAELKSIPTAVKRDMKQVMG